MSSKLARPTAFEPLKHFESELFLQLQNCSESQTRTLTVSAAVTAADRQIRGAFLRWFLLEALPNAALAITKLELQNINVPDEVDLRRSELKLLLTFINCKFDGEINLTDSTITGIEMLSSEAEDFIADRVEVPGSLRFNVASSSESAHPRLRHLRLCGATIKGNLNLKGCHLHGKDHKTSASLLADGLNVHGHMMLSGGFKSEGEILLDGSEIGQNLDCSGGTFLYRNGRSLSATRARIAGSLRLCVEKSTEDSGCVQFRSEGMVQLNGAHIGVNLDCTGGDFAAQALLESSRQPKATKTSEIYAIKANGMDVDADVKFASSDEFNVKFCARGIVSLINAKIGGDLDCSSGYFDFSGEEPFCADNVTVTGDVFLYETETNGILRFVQANLKQGFWASGTKFDSTKGCRYLDPDNNSKKELGGPACGIYASAAEVSGTFYWHDIKKVCLENNDENKLWLDLSGSKANSIDDDQGSWKILDRFDVEDCKYNRFASLAADAGWRLGQLNREYALSNFGSWQGLGLACKALQRALRRRLPAPKSRNKDWFDDAIVRFKPQPYLQLANAFHEAGYEKAASDVLVSLERNKTRYSDFGVRWQLWRIALDVFLKYGFSPFRPILILIVWAIFSALVFQVAFENGRIVMSKDNQQADAHLTNSPRSGAADPSRIAFNPLLYATDTLVPIVDLNQKKNWVVQPVSSASLQQDERTEFTWRETLWRVWMAWPDWGAPLLFVFNTFFGWTMTTFFVAGISGLVRREG
jgi:hypothetical protein